MSALPPSSLPRPALARLVATHLPREGFVNLGIGAPTQVGDFLTEGSGVMLHSENGLLNVGPRPPVGQEDYDLINAGKSPVTLLTGGSYFDSSLSFAMMRGGHLDVAVLGAFQVSRRGDLANWSTGETNGEPPGVGGAIDLAVGARAIWVMMDHTTRSGEPRLVDECTYPLTAAGVVTRIFTNVAIIEVKPGGLVLEAMLESLTVGQVQAMTGTPLEPAPHVLRIAADGTMA